MARASTFPARLLGDTMTLSKVMTQYLQWRAVNRGSTPDSVAQYERAYRTFLAHLHAAGLQDVPASFTRDTLLNWSLAEGQRGVGPRTIASRIGMLSSLADFMLEQKDGRGRPLLAENPTKGFRRPKYQKGEMQFLYGGELRDFIQVERPMREAMARDLLIDTMLRVSEVCEANVGDFVELDGGRYYLTTQVKGQRAKGAQKKFNPISPPVAEALKSYLLARGMIDPQKSANEPLLVNSRGKRWTRNALTDLMARIGRKAGITRLQVSAHKLRHTGNVVGRRGGLDAVVRSALLNHSNTRTVTEYDHLIPDETYEARLKQREGFLRYIGHPPASS
jgi:integrase/recombinase XerD